MHSVQPGSLKIPLGVGSTSVNDIPSEIITQILLVYLRTFWDTRKSPSCSSQPHILLRGIRLTCKRWRDIIAYTPEFWAFVDIQIASSGTPSSSLSELDRWLERSRQLPLTISFDMQASVTTHAHATLTTRNTAPESPANLLLQRLMDHVSRWQDVSLNFSLPQSSSYTLPPFSITHRDSMIAPILESLSISADTRFGYHRVLQWITPFLVSSPRLHSFADNHLIGLPLYLVPLSQLREITLERRWTPIHALQILAKMPMLERCQLSLSFDEFEEPSTEAFPTICSAKSMILSIADIGPTFFTYLIAPNLTELSYHVELSPPRGFHQSFCSFLTNIHGQMTSFTITDRFMKSNELLELLRILSPSLEKLEILAEETSQLVGLKSFSKRIVVALTYHGQIPLDGGNSGKHLLLCPKLQVLRLERCEDAVEDGLISNMVASRRAHDSSSGVSELFFFSILFLCQSSHPLDVERLIQMRRTGLIGTTKFVHPDEYQTSLGISTL